MTQKEFIRNLAKKTNLKIKTVKKVIDQLFPLLSEVIADNNKITINNFGTFNTVTKNERIGRNPKTGEEIFLPKKTFIKFKASSKLTSKINNN